MRDFLMICGLSLIGHALWKARRWYQESVRHAQTQAICDRCFKAGMRYQAQIMAEQRAKRVADLARLVFSQDQMVERLRQERNAFRGQN